MIIDLKNAAVVDFETHPILPRPLYPPAPVGVAIRVGGRSRYVTHLEDMRRALAPIWESGRQILFHNARFDLDVAEEHLGLPPPPWDRAQDTLPALFLQDPDAPSFSLKPSAERLLGMKPDERDAVEEWLLEHQPLRHRGVRMSTSRSSEHYVGAYIAFAPPALVGKYAIGDVDRTFKIAERVLPELERRGMAGAYDRERRLLPAIREMERQGLRVHLEALERDVPRYEAALLELERWLLKRLQCSDNLNFESPDQVGAALVEAGVATLNKTKTGKWEVNRDALMAGVTDRQVLHALKWRSQVSTCLKTFMRPWLATARLTGGLIYTEWVTTRRDKGGGTGGARTGRLQSSPNFQNLPRAFEALWREDVDETYARANEMSTEETRALRKSLPSCPVRGLPPQPRVRRYVAPWTKGHITFGRDYSQQEPRILAHFEDGVLKEAYLKNPWMDYHDEAKVRLETVLHRTLKRKAVKIANLSLIYGIGVGLLAERIGTTVEEARELKTSILKIYPGLRDLYDEAKQRARANEPIRTWGGREHFCEPPKVINGELRHFDYKLPNKLIQGSAADCTKEAMIRFHNAKASDTRLVLSVHDELVASCPREMWREQMEVLRECMEGVEFDVPMLSEGMWSDKSWGDLVDYDKRGKLV